MSAGEFYQIFSGFGRSLRDQQDREDQKSALAKLGQQVQLGDYGNAAQTAFGAGDVQTGIGLLKLGETAQQRKLTAAADADFARGFGGFGVGGPVGAPAGPATAPTVPSFLDTSGPQGDYLAGVFKRESNMNTMAQAPTSSARGLGQFTKDTWNGVAQKYPDLGLTPVGPGTDGRTDPNQMVAATKALTSENEGFLNRAGLPVTNATRYALHFLGPGGGVRLVGGTMRNPDVPAASYASPQAVAANRNVFFNRDGSAKTAGQVMQDFASSFGGGGGGGRGAPQAAAPQVASAGPSFAPSVPGPLNRPLQPPVQGLNPGRPQAPAAPVQQPVQVADDENQTQVLEGRMGMYPPNVYGVAPPAAAPPARVAAADPRADMPAPDAQPAEFQILPGPQQAVGSVAALPAGLSSPQPRGPLQPPVAPSAPVPALPVQGGAPARVMAMPGDGPAPVGQAAATPVDHAFSAQSNAIAQAPASQRIAFLARAVANPNLSEGPRQVAQTMFKQALEETAMPPAVREYVYAKANGYTQARSPAEYAGEIASAKRGPTTLAPGTSVYDPATRSIVLTAPRADDTKLTNVPAGTTVFDPVTRQPVYTAPATEKADEGTKIAAQIEARRQAAPGLGLQEGSPSWRSFVATGKVGADRDMSAGDKKAIDTADNAVLSAQSSISLLEQAKKLSADAYGGPLAKQRGDLMSAAGFERGQATQELDNLVTTNALTNLKSIFGGNPTEGERKILLDVAGSSSLPHALRVKVYQRAIDAAQLRMQQNLDRGNAIREGTYYRPGSGPAAAQGAAGGGQSGAPALPAPSPSNRPGAMPPAARFQQLIGSGMSKTDAYQQLHQEGY